MLLSGVNHGNAWSLYCHDPEGNRIEMFLDSPFYVRQPCIDKLDLSLTDAQILKATIDAFGDDVATRPRRYIISKSVYCGFKDLCVGQGEIQLVDTGLAHIKGRVQKHFYPITLRIMTIE